MISTPRDRASLQPTKLQRQIAAKIVEYIRDHGLRKGDHLTELALAEVLQVSRTPVRAALKYLATQDIVAPSGPRRGFSVRAPAASVAKLARETNTQTDEDALYLKFAEDYTRGELREQFSEADLMRQYGTNRGLLVRVLQRMSKEGVIERNPGYGWRFAPLLRTDKGHAQSYRFRLAVEPAALLEPDFALDKLWAARSRREHEAILARPDRLAATRFFEVNTDFHETLAACSGNRFFHHTVQFQSKLRRFLTYSWNYGIERITASCQEHLGILTALERGDQEWASSLMRRHLQLAANVTPVLISMERGTGSNERTAEREPNSRE